MTDIHRRASDVLVKHRLGFLGLVVEDDRNLERDFHNAAEQETHEVEIQVADVAAGGADRLQFTLSRADLGDTAFDFTTSADAETDAAAAAEIVDEFNSNSDYTAYGWASADGDKVLIRALLPGTAGIFTVGSVSAPNELSASVSVSQTGADPSVAPFGSAILGAPRTSSDFLDVVADWGRGSGRVGEMRGAVVPSALAPASATVTVGANENAKTGIAFVQIDKGITLSATFSTGADADATATNIAAAIDALPDVSASADGAVVTATAPYIGVPLTVQVFGTEAQTTTFTVASVDTGFPADIQGLLLGIVVYKPTMYDTKVLGEAATGVPADEEGILLEEGFFLTKLDAASQGTQSLFVGTSGAERGKLFTTASATRVLWKRCISVASVRDGFTLCRLLPLSV